MFPPVFVELKASLDNADVWLIGRRKFYGCTIYLMSILLIYSHSPPSCQQMINKFLIFTRILYIPVVFFTINIILYIFFTCSPLPP